MIDHHTEAPKDYREPDVLASALDPASLDWRAVAEICAQMCESRSRSLMKDGAITAATEASKCASVIRNPNDYWRERLSALTLRAN